MWSNITQGSEIASARWLACAASALARKSGGRHLSSCESYVNVHVDARLCELIDALREVVFDFPFLYIFSNVVVQHINFCLRNP